MIGLWLRMVFDAPELKLTKELCHQKAAECHALASATKSETQQIMLDHIAETWQRIANTVE